MRTSASCFPNCDRDIYGNRLSHAWDSLAPSSPGFDAGEKIPNFNDHFTGAAPDIGAHEAGTPPMEFGVDACRKK